MIEIFKQIYTIQNIVKYMINFSIMFTVGSLLVIFSSLIIFIAFKWANALVIL